MKKQQNALTVELVKKIYSAPEITELASADETAANGGGGPDFASEAS
jgi:hypothetical protein